MSWMQHDPGTSRNRRSRRQILRLAVTSAAGLGATALLAACGASAAQTTSTGGSAAATSAAATSAAATSAAATSAVASAAPTTSAASASSAAATASAAAASAPAPTATLPPVEHVGSGTEVRWQAQLSPAELQATQKTLQASFVPKFPNIKVTIEPSPDNRDEKLIAEMVAGTAPDIFETWSDNVQQFAEKGQVLDVQPLVDKSKVDTSDFFKWQWRDFSIPIKGGPKYGGSIIRFGMPRYVNVMALWVNKDMFKAKGVDLPTLDWDQDDYANAMRKLVQMDGSKVKVGGAHIPMDSWDRYWYRLQMWGGYSADPNDPTKCDMGQKPAQDALEWARKLVWDEKVLLVSLSGMPQVQGDRFFAGQYAIQEDGFYPFENAMRNATSKIDWEFAHVPKGPVQRKVLGTTDGYAIWKQTPHQDEAWTLVQFLTGEDYQLTRVETTGRIPIRNSVLAKWKGICIKQYPELENANLDVALQAMQMGYPGNRNWYVNNTAAQELIVPALQKVYDIGQTPVTYFQQVADQVSQRQKSS